MATKYVRLGSSDDVLQYDDGDFNSGVETDGKIEAGTAPVAGNEVLRYADIAGIILAGGVTTVITVVTQIQAGGLGAVGFQYKNRTVTFSAGVATAVGAESGWIDV